MAPPDHPCTVNVLAHLRHAGANGLRASVLIELIDKVQPLPPAVVLLRQLVEAGYATAAPTPVITESILVLTGEGEAHLAAAVSAGAWLCWGGPPGRGTVLTEAGILEFLRSIERGEVSLTRDVDSSDVFSGIVPYTASNGWRLAVFYDCNAWDYIEWVEANGHRVTFEDIDNTMPELSRYAPSGDVAKLAYKMRRVTRALGGPEATRYADARAFAQVHEVLAGKRHLDLDGISSKALRIMLGGSSTDTLITSERFAVHFGNQKQRSPCTYYRRLAPRAMSELLRRAALAAVSEPLVIGLPAGEVPTILGFVRWSYPPKLIWIVPTQEMVKVIARPSPARWQAPFVRAVPQDGPYALRELPEWAPREVYTEFATAVRCPVCSNASTRYRTTQKALVCAKCGRSFEHTG